MPISAMTSSRRRRIAQYDSPVSRSISLTLPRLRTKTSRNLRLSGERRKNGESSNFPTTPVPHTVQLSWVTTSGDEQLGQIWGMSGILGYSNAASLANIFIFVNIFGV